MIRICCVCKKVIGEKEPLDDKSETHTVCPDCFGKEIEKQEKLLTDGRIFVLRITSRKTDKQKGENEQGN